MHPQQLQQIEETREPPARKLQDDHKNTMRGDRHHSTVVKHTHTQSDMAPTRHQTVLAYHQSTKGGGHERQEHNSKQHAEKNLQALLQRAQKGNKTLSSGSRAPKQHSNHLVKGSGQHKPRELRFSDKQHVHHTATSSGSELGKRLKASIPKLPQSHEHPSSHRVQTQPRTQIPPSSSSLYKQAQKDQKTDLARVLKEEQEEEEASLWSDLNVATYERDLPASVAARPTKPNTATVFIRPKTLASRQQRDGLIPSHAKLPSSALRSQKPATIIGRMQAKTKREIGKRARAQDDLAADDEEDLPKQREKPGKFFGGNVHHEHREYSAATAASMFRAFHHDNETPTQDAADDNDAKPSLIHGAASGSNNLPGIHPGSLPSSSGLNYVPNNDEKFDPTDQQPPPEGPFFLNSPAEVRAIEKIIPAPPLRAMELPYDTSTCSRNTVERFMGKSSKHRAKTAGLHEGSPFPKSAASKAQIYITANDLHLYKWRQEKLIWAATRENWSKLPGADAYLNRSEDSMRAHFRAVSKLIEVDEVTQDLCNSVLEGVEGAEEELNRIVTEVQQRLQQQTRPELELGTGGFKKITSGKSAAGIKQEIGRQQQLQQQQQQQVSATFQQQPYAGILPANPPLAIAGTYPPSPLRPTAGGKFYDAITFQAYLTHVAEAQAQDSDSDSDADYIDLNNPREASPVCAADTVQWEYFMQRRDFTAEDLAALPVDPTTFFDEVQVEEDNNDNNMDEIYNPSILWKTYDHPFRTLSDASAEGAKFVWSTPLGAPQTYDPAGVLNLTCHPDAFGMSTFSLKSVLGLSQVRIGRRLLTYKDHVFPGRGEKARWIPRVMWCVFVRVRDNSKKGNEDEGESSIAQNKVVSSLALANSIAIDEWLKLTLKIRSANLNQRKIETESAKIALLETLETIGHGGDEDDDGTGERAKYFREVLVEEPVEGEAGSGRRVEVYVKELVLEGPRN